MNNTFTEIWELIQSSQKILLSFHPRPDPDSIGSNLAMFLILKKLGKEPLLISGDDHKPPALDFLSGYQEVANKNLSEISWGDFDLFISLDAGEISRVSSKVNLGSKLPIKTAMLDHHKSNPGFGDLNYLDIQAGSTCALLWKFFKSVCPELLDAQIASCLYSGIYSDSGGFISATPEILGIASECLKFGIDANQIVKATRSVTKNKLRVMGVALANMSEFFSGQLVLAKVSRAGFQKYSIPDDEVGELKENILSQLTFCTDALIDVLIYEYATNLVSISIRSYNPKRIFDISLIAKSMGGGGHTQAASAKFSGSVDQAQQAFLAATSGVFPDLGSP